MTASEIEQMFKDTGGEQVTLGSDSTYGHIDDMTVSDDEGRAAVLGQRRSVLVATGLLTTLADGASITVGATTYEVRESRTEEDEDGSTTRIFLADA